MRKASLICSVLLLLFAVPLMAQNANEPQPTAKASDQPAHYYRLQFVVQEVNEQGKPTNSRTFTTTVSTDSQESARIRTGSRIPIATGSFAAGADKPTSTQFQYVDVGTNFDVRRTHEIGRELSLILRAELTSVGPTPDQDLHQPVIRQNQWEGSVVIPIGKPTVVFSSDTLESKGSMQIVVTATPLP